VTLEASRPPLLLLLLRLLLLLLLLLVPLGEITPRWWWWRRDRRTDAPLRVVGLGLTSSALPAVLWRFWGALKRATRQRDVACAASPPPTPRSYVGRRHRLQPLYPCPRGWGPRRGWRWELHQRAGDLQAVHRRFESHGGGLGRSGEPPRSCRRGSAAWPRSLFSGLGRRRAQGCSGVVSGTQGQKFPQ
jgi:hypothetical protein